MYWTLDRTVGPWILTDTLLQLHDVTALGVGCEGYICLSVCMSVCLTAKNVKLFDARIELRLKNVMEGSEAKR
jgi:hypothetical protein